MWLSGCPVLRLGLPHGHTLWRRPEGCHMPLCPQGMSTAMMIAEQGLTAAVQGEVDRDWLPEP